MATSLGQYRTRRIFLILLDDGIELALYLDTATSVRLSEPIDKVVNSQFEHGTVADRIDSFADCTVWDYSMNQLPDDIEVRSIPEPGVVYILPKVAKTFSDLGLTEGEDDMEPFTPDSLKALVDMAIRTDDTYGPRLDRFLTSPDALFVPDPIPNYDVFISFAAADFLLASDLALKLSSQHLRCFLANTSIAPGSLWAEELRVALRSSRRLVLVASENAGDSSWVMSEIGAAWVLEVPVLVARAGDSESESIPVLDSLGVATYALDEVPQLPEFQREAFAQ